MNLHKTHQNVWFDQPTMGRLSRALDGSFVRDQLQLCNSASKSWISVPNHMSVRRLHHRGKHGYIIEYLATFKTGRAQHTQLLFGELPLYNAFDRKQQAVRRISRSILPINPNLNVGSHFALIEELGLIIRSPGFDERIDGLSMLWRTPSQHDAEGHLNPVPQLLAHRLGKRAVLKFIDGEKDELTAKSFVAKLYNKHSKSWTLSRTIADCLRHGDFLPESDTRVLRSSVRLDCDRSDTMEFIDGPSLHELRADQAEESYFLAGKAIARMHSTRNLPQLTYHRPADEAHVLRQWLATIEDLRPIDSLTFRRLFELVDEELGKLPSHLPCLIHRDFHQKQVLTCNGAVYLIDFDTACLGDPAVDVGNFLAHIRLLELTNNADLSRHAAAFEVGYVACRQLPAHQITAVYRRAAMLRLACIHAFSDQWSKYIPSLLQQIGEA